MRSRLPGLVRSVLNDVPDGELLQRYAAAGSNEDFAQLVSRYARLVWGLCRHLLANEADAEDAFQATFIVLARSAHKLLPGAPLGPWLHGTAYRVCMKARRALARRTRGERAAAAARVNHSQPVADFMWESAFAALCEEVHHLPEPQRAAFVLCCLDGRTQVDAATALGQKIGTFAAQLKRAKQTLLERLARRGFGAGAVALGTVAGSGAGASAALVERTLSLLGSGAAVPRSILVLTQGVTGMAVVRLKVLVCGILVAGCFSLGAVSGWSDNAAGQPPTDPNETPAGANDPARAQPPAGDPEVEKAKADYEKAKLDLEKAAEELRSKVREAQARAKEKQLLEERRRLAEVEALRQATDARAKEKQLLEERRRLAEAEAWLKERQSGKFVYVPVPKEGFTVEEFEKRIAEHEQKGLSYSGEATIRSNQGAGRMLVFRSKARVADPAAEKPDRNTPSSSGRPLQRP